MCTVPLAAWYKNTVNEETGKTGITFSRKEANLDRPLMLPCGKCIECRRNHINQWTLRCVLEAAEYRDTCFITLTYSDEHLPKYDESGHYGKTLRHKDFQDFMKRFRKHLGDYHDHKKIKYFMCGEYGGKTARPHYHAIIFGHRFDDLVVHEQRSNHTIYRSETLARLWSKGFVTVGDCHRGTIKYVAKYAAKRFGGEDAQYGKKLEEIQHHYTKNNQNLRMEYLRASQGMGKRWCLSNAKSILLTDKVAMGGKTHQTPKQFLNWLTPDYPDAVQRIKDNRALLMKAQTQWKLTEKTFVNRKTGEVYTRSHYVALPVDKEANARRHYLQLIEAGIAHLYPLSKPIHYQWDLKNVTYERIEPDRRAIQIIRRKIKDVWDTHYGHIRGGCTFLSDDFSKYKR